MRKRRIFISILVVLAVIITIAVSGYLTINSKLSKLKTTKISQSPSSLGINTEKFNTNDINNVEENYINILLLGVDKLNETNDTGRADSNIILTLDKVHKKIKLTSLMRDMLMNNVGSKAQDKLTHAYAYGGPELSLKVVNDNLQMNMKDFVKVDFVSFYKIVDAIGGVDLNVADSEIASINKYIKEVAVVEKKTPFYLTKGGMQKLNGMQALAYCRIRSVGNGDFERTQRQRAVLIEIFNKISSMNLSQISNMLDTVLPYVETSLSKKAILSYTSYALINNIKTVEQLRLPEDKTGYSTNRIIHGVFYLDWNREGNIADLHQFIFEGDLK
ncbi:LCP family protein [Clostridium pasteurianum]|uniref:Cell envelope-related function transcriptional attenuator common domain protein n=1 Tax=Clostridium pasteurianum BC1 TaxID=86416 RepID=R4K857_CLOPA|nr:LCP family protein [Clostridium pasteurianum]AGK95825.1 cell envelope-related function transcriptional attenuator common domain protein [Clostridium pasteurianum BC1]